MARHVIDEISALRRVHLLPTLDDFTLAEWVKKLETFEPAVLRKVCDDAKVMVDCPKLGELIEMCRNRSKSSTIRRQLDFKRDNSGENKLYAIMSMLWLHYNNDFYSTDFLSGPLCEEVFQRSFPGEKFDVQKLKEQFPKEQVDAWMKSQERKDAATLRNDIAA